MCLHSGEDPFSVSLLTKPFCSQTEQKCPLHYLVLYQEMCKKTESDVRAAIFLNPTMAKSSVLKKERNNLAQSPNSNSSNQLFISLFACQMRLMI